MKGKVAIITASSTGIGKAIAQSLAKQGVKVIISSRDRKNIDQAVSQLTTKGYEAYGIVCNVGNKEQRTHLINQTLKKYGRIDYLIPNAASSNQLGPYLKATEQQIQQMFQINYKSTFLLIQQAIPHLQKQKGSSIVILASYLAYELSNMIGHYSVTKIALVAMTKILAKQLLHDQIRVNCVCPGLIKTQFSQPLWKNEKKAIQNMGVTRLGVPEDISGVVRFLLSDEARYMTGESLVVAGKAAPRL